jgi:cytochrome c oxidase subunit 4
MSTHEHTNQPHAVPLPILLGVWALLIILTWATVAATKVDLGSLNILLALIIAVVKSTFVALYFMHLRWDKPINAIIFCSALLFVALFISFALMDTKQYKPSKIPGYQPTIGWVAPSADGPVPVDGAPEVPQAA